MRAPARLQSQAADAAGNNHACRRLPRDRDNLRQCFHRHAPEPRATEWGAETWARAQASARRLRQRAVS